jgi:predicted nucleic-acid-binding protein
MISVDTNVLVRVVTRDDPDRARRGAAVLAQGPVWIAKTVLLEMEWVLRYAYRLKKPAILNAFHGILGLPNVEIEDSLAVSQALKWYQSGLDFADALHLASSGAAKRFMTFDEDLKKRAARIPGLAIGVFS